MSNAAWKLLAEWEIRGFTSPLPTLVERRTCQSLGIPSIGLDELKVTTSPRGKAAQVQSSSMAEAAGNLELWDCYSFGRCGPDHFTFAGGSFARCSRVTLSLRGPIECVVRWNRTGIARDGTLRSRFQLLLPASDPFVGSKARRNTTPCHIHGFSPICRVAERCRKECHRIAPARAMT